jgi:anti-sigma B factor antagonist
MVTDVLPVVRRRQRDRLPDARLLPPEVPGIDVSCHAEGGCLVVALSGQLDVTSAPALRECLLRLLRPAASRLVIDLSAVSTADSRGLTVLVGTERRARLLGGFLRLAAPVPAVTEALRANGLGLQFDIYPTLEAAVSCPAPA